MMTTGEDQRRPREDLTPSLILSLRGGNAEAGALLDQLYRQRMIQFCVGYLGNPEEAEDVVQDVFCTVLASTTVPDSFRAWLYRITRNRCLDALRARGRRRDGQLSESRMVATLTGNLTRLVRRELHSQLQELVAALPDSQRDVLRLRYAEGLSRTEIAQVLDISESLVRSRLFHALEKLRQQTSSLDRS